MRTGLLLFIFSMGSFLNLAAQFDEDARRLGEMAYMKDIGNIDCNEIISNREARICYNLRFQQTDSLLNVKLEEYLSTFSNDSLKAQFLSHHRSWIEYRRFQSKLYSEGNQRHFMGIRYLSAMTNLSKLKIEELSLLMDEEGEE